MGNIMRKSALNLLAAAALVACASQANALESVSFPGFAHGSQTVGYTLTAPNITASGSANAGGFLTSLNGGTSFTTYCVDLYHSISMEPTYTDYSVVSGASYAFATPNPTNASANANLGKLFAAGHAVNNAQTEAAFQLAVWEITYETSGSFNLMSGDASFTGNSATLSLAQSWLDGLQGVGSASALTVLSSPTHQDVVYTTPVPEPETYALMLAGLMGIGFVAKRRQAKR